MSGRFIVIASILFCFLMCGCSMLDMLQGSPVTTGEEGGSGIVDKAIETVVNIATGSGLLPPWSAPFILGIFGIGTGTLVVKGRKHKRERIKLASIVETLKEIAPEDVNCLLDELDVKDTKFYEKHIKVEKEDEEEEEDV